MNYGNLILNEIQMKRLKVSSFWKKWICVLLVCFVLLFCIFCIFLYILGADSVSLSLLQLTSFMAAAPHCTEAAASTI